MVALMNIDDAYDKDLHFVFPWSPDRGQQRTSVIEDEKGGKKRNVFLIYCNISCGPETTFCPLYYLLYVYIFVFVSVNDCEVS